MKRETPLLMSKQMQTASKKPFVTSTLHGVVKGSATQNKPVMVLYAWLKFPASAGNPYVAST